MILVSCRPSNWSPRPGGVLASARVDLSRPHPRRLGVPPDPFARRRRRRFTTPGATPAPPAVLPSGGPYARSPRSSRASATRRLRTGDSSAANSRRTVTHLPTRPRTRSSNAQQRNAVGHEPGPGTGRCPCRASYSAASSRAPRLFELLAARSRSKSGAPSRCATHLGVRPTPLRIRAGFGGSPLRAGLLRRPICRPPTSNRSVSGL